MNLYTYVHNNPINNIDPTGHQCYAVVNGTTYSHSDHGKGAAGCSDSKNYIPDVAYDAVYRTYVDSLDPSKVSRVDGKNSPSKTSATAKSTTDTVPLKYGASITSSVMGNDLDKIIASGMAGSLPSHIDDASKMLLKGASKIGPGGIIMGMAGDFVVNPNDFNLAESAFNGLTGSVLTALGTAFVMGALGAFAIAASPVVVAVTVGLVVTAGLTYLDVRYNVTPAKLISK